MKDPGGSGMVEADVTINGVALDFGESMTVRVAVSSFLMYVGDPETNKALGPIGEGYRRCLESVMRMLHDPIVAEQMRRAQERGMTYKPRTK